MLIVIAVSFFAPNVYANPTSINAAIKLRTEGHLEEAIAAFRLVLTDNRDQPNVWVELATTYAWKQNFEDSLAAFGNALKLDPDHIGARFGRARTLAWKGEFSKALREYRELQGDFPDHLEPLRGIAFIKRYTLKLGEAKQLYREILRRSPADIEAQQGLDSTLAATKNHLVVMMGAASRQGSLSGIGAAHFSRRFDHKTSLVLGYRFGSQFSNTALSQLGINEITSQLSSSILFQRNKLTINTGYEFRHNQQSQTHSAITRLTQRLSSCSLLLGLQPGFNSAGQFLFLADAGIQVPLGRNNWVMARGFVFAGRGQKSSQSLALSAHAKKGSFALDLSGAATRNGSEFLVNGTTTISFATTKRIALLTQYDIQHAAGILQSVQFGIGWRY